jgi:hypothetical protein
MWLCSVVVREASRKPYRRGPTAVGLAACRGSLPPAVNFYRSCIGLGWLAQETTGFILVRASEE